MSIMEAFDVRYAFDTKTKVLRGINAQLDLGKMYAILGPSGCGKTTLLALLGGLDSPTSGQVRFAGEDIKKTGLANHRRHHVSFIFQNYNLIDYLNPIENVELTAKMQALPVLMGLGLTEAEAKRSVLKLSGGQQQRVAIARALASGAPVIIGDEPTGSLDEETAFEITSILSNAAHEAGKCVIVATHSHELAGQADVILQLRKGQLQVVSQETFLESAAKAEARIRKPIRQADRSQG